LSTGFVRPDGASPDSPGPTTILTSTGSVSRALRRPTTRSRKPSLHRRIPFRSDAARAGRYSRLNRPGPGWSSASAPAPRAPSAPAGTRQRHVTKRARLHHARRGHDSTARRYTGPRAPSKRVTPPRSATSQLDERYVNPLLPRAREGARAHRRGPRIAASSPCSTRRQCRRRSGCARLSARAPCAGGMALPFTRTRSPRR
jgi:hypothetical protein